MEFDRFQLIAAKSKSFIVLSYASYSYIFFN